MNEDELQALYQWVDEIPLSRPKRNIARDFSDGVLMAEVTKHFFPRLVELHNYSGTQSAAQKVYNWSTLDVKAFKKINFVMTKEEIQDVANSVPGAIEKILFNFKTKVAQVQQRKLHVQRSQASRDATQEGSHPTTATIASPDDTILSQYAARPMGFHSGKSSQKQASEHVQRNVLDEIVAEKDRTIQEMKDTIEILEEKIRKLEQLVSIKDQKLVTLQSKLQHPNQIQTRVKG
jgi:hypothetical protein